MRNWHLRQAQAQDTDELLELLSEPPVYRYLLDGSAPERTDVEQLIESHQPDSEKSEFGLWLLQSDRTPLSGFVSLKPYPQPATAELTYGLHPQFWGMGLATRMGWTIIVRTFSSDNNIQQIIAGADEPNIASVTVMCRLGMSFLRSVIYPLGPGVEYVFRRGNAAPNVLPKVLPLRQIKV